LLYKILNKRFNTIITASNAIRDIHITDGVDKKKVITVYNGVDLVRFSNVNKMKVRKELDIGNDEIILGMIANLSPVKNHRDVILCIKKFHDNNINLHLVLAGDGPLRDDLQSFTEELGLNRYIHFLGRRKDIPDILSGIDIFVLASKTEGLSNALLEAMAANKPVVATNVGGNPEVVINQETGYLIPSNNPDALYDAIHKLVISESKCKKFGETGHGRVSEIFSVESMIEKYESEIEKAITQQEKQPG
jgi:glycosyltransferase involved in cell wall biosynthesis